jgi:aryl-alcohol dehydrogenase-like predicted oxidoreductase
MPLLETGARDRARHSRCNVNYRVLGKTGLKISVLGLGTGTRFGDPRAHSATEAARLVAAALDLGINYFDVAAMYGEAESWLGRALTGRVRDDAVIATKVFPVDESNRPITPAQLRASVERSLIALNIETIDILQVHGLRPGWLPGVMDALGSENDALQREGKFRFLGVAETIVEDPRHAMVPLAATTGRISMALVAYSLLSPWAELSALPACAASQVGVVAMVAVRRALRDPAMLAQLISAAKARGEAGVQNVSLSAPLNWLLDGNSPSLMAAGYRFALSHPAVACVLSGTLNPEHLRANAVAACAPPLTADQLARVRDIFLRTDPERWKTYDL